MSHSPRGKAAAGAVRARSVAARVEPGQAWMVQALRGKGGLQLEGFGGWAVGLVVGVQDALGALKGTTGLLATAQGHLTT